MKQARMNRVMTSLALLLAFGSIPQIQYFLFKVQPVLAQTAAAPTFPLPQDVADGTKVIIESSSTLATITNALKQQFESQYAGTSVSVATKDVDTALQAVREGTADLAAIGRPLTAAEKAEGLVEVPITRHKIALFTTTGSPYQGGLTIEQFAQIFRGEITNWEQLGGPSAPIKLVDRPASSDTRQSFQSYPMFQTGSLQAGSTAVSVEDDTTKVIERLGTDGIGYAIADQVLNQPGLRIIPMYNTLPDDPRYPFSQPLAYVYKGPEPNAAVKAFLGFATTSENQQIIEEARAATAITANPGATAAASPEVTAASPAPTTTAPTTTAPAEQEARQGAFPWWLLLLPLLVIPFFLLRKKGAVAPVAAVTDRRSRMVLTPRNCRDAYAYWELSQADRAALSQVGSRPALRLYEVTGIDMDTQQPHSMKQFELPAHAEDLHIPISLDNRDYVAELGYTGNDGRWVRVARSEHVRVPTCEPLGDGLRTSTSVAAPLATVGTLGAVGAAAGAVGAATGALSPRKIQDNRIILVPRSSSDAYAFWEIPEEKKADLRKQGGKDLKLRLYDVTGIDLDTQQPNSIREFGCNELDQDRHLPIYTRDRDYLVELGYTTDDGHWLSLARSAHVHIPERVIETPVSDRV